MSRDPRRLPAPACGITASKDKTSKTDPRLSNLQCPGLKKIRTQKITGLVAPDRQKRAQVMSASPRWAGRQARSRLYGPEPGSQCARKASTYIKGEGRQGNPGISPTSQTFFSFRELDSSLRQV